MPLQIAPIKALVATLSTSAISLPPVWLAFIHVCPQYAFSFSFCCRHAPKVKRILFARCDGLNFFNIIC
eukprot:6209442-Pleurochrysis_carterae.AAC.1